MLLCTAEPKFRVEGEQIIMTVPSGKDRIEIAVQLNHLLSIHHGANRAVQNFYARPMPSTAQIVPFNQRRA